VNLMLVSVDVGDTSRLDLVNIDIFDMLVFEGAKRRLHRTITVGLCRVCLGYDL
jgi:hypothetical protein